VGRSLAIVLAMSLSGGLARAEPAPCGDLVLALSAPAADGQARADVGELRWLAGGKRSLLRRGPRPGDEQRYLVQTRADGESYALGSGDAQPVLYAAFETDRSGCVQREILRRPRQPLESDLAGDVVGWFEYRRDLSGRLTGLVQYEGSGADLRWFTDDDVIKARPYLRE
jgi:hypothetical protein